jgi:hypothetical protein
VAEAGWYPDPQDATALQYYDGQRWTGDTRPANVPAQPAAQPTQPETSQQTEPRQPAPQPGQPTQAIPAVPEQPQQWQAPQIPYAPQPPEQQQSPYQPTQQSPYQPTQSLPSVPPTAPWSAPQPWQQQPGQGGQPPQPWGPQPPAGGTPPRRSRKKLLIGAGVVVVLVAGGLAGWKLLSGDDKPKLTYQGRQIADPDKVLQAAEATVTADVTKRHGAKNDASRCYFSQAKKTPSGQKKTDVDNNLLCGPVLFVDGDDSKPYISVPLQDAVSGNKTTLTPSSSLDDAENVAAPDNVKLVRPDNKSAPDGSGGLKVPQPPAAEKDVLLTAPLGETSPPPSLPSATMVGKNESVTVVSAGVVPRYGSGDDARSAPDGQQLLAFRIATDDGDLGAPPASGGLTVAVSGGQARAVPDAADPEDYVILAMPASSTASLILNDGGFKQTLSLPAGKAGTTNIAVLARKHRYVAIAKSANVPIHLSNGTNSANVTFRATVTSAALDFWVPRHTDKHPTNTASALLSVDLSYKDPDSGTFGWDPELLKLHLPNGTVVAAQNIAAAKHIFIVFQVPAGFTTGTLAIGGSEVSQGITLKVSKVARFTISIPAG